MMMMMSEWLTPTPQHITNPLGSIKNKKIIEQL